MSWGRSATPIALLLLLWLALAGAVGGAVATDGDVQGLGASGVAATTPANVSQPLNTTYTVTVRANGDARWEIQATFPLRTTAELESFSTIAEAFGNGESPRLGLDAFRSAAELSGRATGRSMSIDAVERSATVPTEAPGNGTLTLGFTWNHFARTDGDTVIVGDAFHTSPQWFPGLDPNQKLRIRPPQGFSVVSTTVPLQNRSLVWTGPTTIDPADISAAFASNGITPSPTPVTTTTTPPPTTEGTFPWLFVLGIVLVGTVVVGFGVLRHRPDALPTGTDDDGATDDAPSGDSAEGVGAETAPIGEEVSEDGVDEELLSDEERIERLLEERGGRMKQASIVTETGWSNAKVSQLLSAMEDEDRINKLRIGRENLISFPDEDVTDIED